MLVAKLELRREFILPNDEPPTSTFTGVIVETVDTTVGDIVILAVELERERVDGGYGACMEEEAEREVDDAVDASLRYVCCIYKILVSGWSTGRRLGNVSVWGRAVGLDWTGAGSCLSTVD